MKIESVIKLYCKCLVKNDLKVILSLFSADAIINSPKVKNETAPKFYAHLFKTSRRTKVSVKHIFYELSSNNLFAAWLDYEGITGGKASNICFECVDIFEFDTNNKIKQLTIIWDTYPVRSQLDQM